MERPYIIGITGGSGSGKTTLIKELMESFTSEELCLVSQDNYYRPREEQHIDDKGVRNFDLPESIDHEAFERDLRKLIAGESVVLKEYVFNNQQAVPRDLVFKPSPVLVLEGIFIFHFEKIAELIDLKVFIEAKENLKLVRRIQRDKDERNYPLDDVLYRYIHHVTPTYEKFIKPYKDDADIIINNNVHFKEAVEVLKGFLKIKVREKKI